MHGLKTKQVDPATVSFLAQLKACDGPGNYQNEVLPDLYTFYTKMFTRSVSCRRIISWQPSNIIMQVDTEEYRRLPCAGQILKSAQHCPFHLCSFEETFSSSSLSF